MHPDQFAARRAFMRAYTAYLSADLAWRTGREEAASFAPEVGSGPIWQIGSPRSRLRRLYEARSHALDLLTITHEQLRHGQTNHRTPRETRRLRITYREFH